MFSRPPPPPPANKEVPSNLTARNEEEKEEEEGCDVMMMTRQKKGKEENSCSPFDLEVASPRDAFFQSKRYFLAIKSGTKKNSRKLFPFFIQHPLSRFTRKKALKD